MTGPRVDSLGAQQELFGRCKMRVSARRIRRYNLASHAYLASPRNTMKYLLLSTLILLTACSKDEVANPNNADEAPAPKTRVSDAATAKSDPEAPKLDAAVVRDAASKPTAMENDTAAKAASPDSGAEHAGGADTPAPESTGPTNLQVLPKKWSNEKVSRYMKQMTRGLGVKCKHCHVKGDNASDKNDAKLAARKMLDMTRLMDRKYMGGKGRVTCFTCHKGKLEF